MQAQARTWTDISGRTLEAEMLGVEMDRVVVLMPGRTRASIPVANLSANDQTWVKTWAEGKTPEALLPPPVWPETVQQPEVHLTEAKDSGTKFIFRSPHYEFSCDDQVSVSVMTDFATVAEGTVRLLEALPIHWPRADGKTFHARIFTSRNGYQEAGGPAGSSGVYITGNISGEGVLLVPFQSLGIEKFNGRNTKSFGYKDTVMIHEMVHQATGGLLFLMPRWVAEGLAEYGAHMTYRNGVFYFTERDRQLALRNRLEYYDRLSKDIIAKNPEAAGNLPAAWIMTPSELMSRPERDWNTANRARGAQIQLHRMYLSSMYLVYYFMHFADNGEARRIRVYFDRLTAASRYFASRGREGFLPSDAPVNVSGQGGLAMPDLEQYFLKELIGDQPISSLDADFRKRFATLGIRVSE